MMDSLARKELLLTRVALERKELEADLKQLRAAATVPAMLRSLVGPGLTRNLLGKKPSGSDGWLSLALSLMSRYRVAATLIGSLLPMLGRRGRSERGARRGGGFFRKLTMLAVAGGTAFAAWKFTKRPGDR